MIENFQITEHFSFFEMTNSEEFPELVEENRKAIIHNSIMILNLQIVCLLLERLRKVYGRIKILSGFRYQKLNESVKGSLNSQHMKAEAVDFTTLDFNIEKLWDLEFNRDGIEPGEVDFPEIKPSEFHQCIWYPKKNFIHLSLPTGQNDGQILVKE